MYRQLWTITALAIMCALLPLESEALTSPGETLDTDGDGMLDCWEKRYSRTTDPNSQELNWEIPDAYQDADGDGVLNIDERQHMTDPTDPNDYFGLESILESISEGGTVYVVVRWHSVEGQYHRVYRSTELGPGASWQLVYGPVSGTGLAMEYSQIPGVGPLFFRVSVEPRQPDYWPNEFSNGNSDDWLLDYHDHIYEMRPKVPVLNFINDRGIDGESKAQDLIDTLEFSSKYRYFKDPDSKWFLQYEPIHIDLRDPPGTTTLDGNSTKYPRRGPPGPGFNFNYGELYSEAFAENYGYEDPENPGEYLTLGELVNLGLVNELWFLAVQTSEYGGPFEAVELKQFYDMDLNRREGVYAPTGNGHDYSIPWIGRSLRINYINGHRGIGCAMENLGHCVEIMAREDFCPYYTKYFNRFGDFDLDEKWGMPIDSFYWYSYDYSHPDYNNFANKSTLEWHWAGMSGTVRPYTACAGNVHFMPNGRWHYDMSNTQPVLSTIEHAFMRDDPNGKDIAEVWTIDKFDDYRAVAPDCMGPWLVYWRQAMPGRNNTCTDDDGNPMPNWWVFLFY